MITIKELENDGRRWFEIDGIDDGTGVEFEHDTYGLTTDGVILDSDGCPITPGDSTEIAVRIAIESVDINVEEEVQENIEPDLKDLNKKMKQYITSSEEFIKNIKDMKRDFAASQTQLDRTGRELSQLLFEIKQLQGECNE